MAEFVYTGKTKEGEKIKKRVTAPDKYAVYGIARENGHIVTSVSEAKKVSIENLLNMEKINYFLSRVKGDELVMVTRNLSAMLKAGLPLSRALSVIERQSKNPRLIGIMKEVREDINKGEPLNASLKKFPKTFSKLYVAMVRAGEESGQLQDTLQTIALQLERSSNLKKKIKGSMIYPAIVISVMIIIGVLMMIYVVPTLIATFKKLEIDLPLSTKVIIWISEFLSTNGLVALLGAITFMILLVAGLRTTPGKRGLAFTVLHLPVIGKIVKEVNAAYTSRTLSSLLGSGVDVISSIKITEEVLQNPFYKEVLAEAAGKVEKGDPLSATFIAHEKIYPVLVGEMILVGEETGQISNMLAQLADFYENEVEQKTKDLSTIIEPILMVVIGAGVGFFAMAMIAPIYSISDSIE